jgi:hypothetical protein
MRSTLSFCGRHGESTEIRFIVSIRSVPLNATAHIRPAKPQSTPSPFRMALLYGDSSAGEASPSPPPYTTRSLRGIPRWVMMFKARQRIAPSVTWPPDFRLARWPPKIVFIRNMPVSARDRM